MPSPFPGVNPFVESMGIWFGFHNVFMSHAAEALNEILPDDYVAMTDERIGLLSLDAGPIEFRPDISVAHRDQGWDAERGDPATATVEPVTIPLARTKVEEVREAWIEVRRLPEEELITVIELLSPTNKVGRGRVEYLEKRDALIDQPVHLVEIDLLLGGLRLPMLQPLPVGHFFVIEARSDRRPDADVYAWSIRQPLPRIPIPLRAPDEDRPLDLQAIFQRTFDRGRYDRRTRSGNPSSLPLSAEDREWVTQLIHRA